MLRKTLHILSNDVLDDEDIRSELTNGKFGSLSFEVSMGVARRERATYCGGVK